MGVMIVLILSADFIVSSIATVRFLNLLTITFLPLMNSKIFKTFLEFNRRIALAVYLRFRPCF